MIVAHPLRPRDDVHRPRGGAEADTALPENGARLVDGRGRRVDAPSAVPDDDERRLEHVFGRRRSGRRERYLLHHFDTLGLRTTPAAGDVRGVRQKPLGDELADHR